MRKIKILLVLLLVVPTFVNAQLDCSGTLKNLQIAQPFKLSSLSKSAVCVSAHTYEFVVPLSSGYQYRFVYYASSAFNNDIHFKMVDLNTNKEIINLPGESETNARSTAVLAPYYDEVADKEIHPFFDILPQTSTSIKIIIDVAEATEIVKGCITVVILDKEFQDGNFN